MSNDNDNKFISRNMYTGSGSRKPITGAILSAVCGLIVIAFGIWRYFSMTSTFDAGGTVSVNRYEHLVYKIGGFPGILITYILIGIAVIYYAY
ncbi:MAG: hypothetical protein HXM99_06705, partial [Porphyromonadaceae bacterium]|nr:hypothetical protein [Porphyromonadaceae bacterium]